MVESIAEKALKTSFAAVKKCSSVGSVTPKISLQLFNSIVPPVFGVWL